MSQNERLLTDGEIRDCLRKIWIDEDLEEGIKIAELEHAKTRQATLQAVGEWLETNVMGAILKAGKDARYFKETLETLKQGKLPE